MMKTKNREEIQTRIVAAREVRRVRLEKIIEAFGSPYKAAKGMNITPSAIYQRMESVGLARKKVAFQGEPKTHKKAWWEEQLSQGKSIKGVAAKVGCSVWVVGNRIKKHRLVAPGKR